MASNTGMTQLPPSADTVTEQRLTELDTLNQLVARQQEQIELLLREVSRLRQRGEPAAAPAAHNSRDELPPHY
jgi:SlyX protein